DGQVTVVRHGGEDDAVDELDAPAADLGEVQDAQADAAYEQRLDELQGLLTGAEGAGDDAKVREYRDEIRQLNRQLQRGRGLGGRRRRLSPEGKKHRDKVCKAINHFLDGLDQDSPLCLHLRRFVAIGPVCCYTPETPTVWKT